MTEDKKNLKQQQVNAEIAIIGMSALFAGAKNLRTYWQNILNKYDAITEAPDDWAVPFFNPDSHAGNRIYTRKGGFLGELAKCKPLDFGVMPNALDGGEPDHYLALQLAKDALDHAGYGKKDFNRENTGVFVGRGTYVNRGFGTIIQHGQVIDQTLHILQQTNLDMDKVLLDEIRKELTESLPPFNTDVITSLVPNVISGRIANRLDLMGPNFLVDAACASSLIALELAVRALREHKADMMLAGGVQASMPPQIYMIFCQLDLLSKTDIRPFGSGADGVLLGEGLGFVVLKRLEDAKRDKDTIYAVIQGAGSSSDGKAMGLLTPRLEGEKLALRRAYEGCEINPDTIELIEGHGTSIALGDRTEVQALAEIQDKKRDNVPCCALGSVKSMIGHCIPAAGIAGLIKTTLALYHKVLPPTICEDVNEELGLEETSLYVNNTTRPWIHGNLNYPRRAGVNAFGFGGVNAHIILEEYQEETSDYRRSFYRDYPWELIALSAEDENGLIISISDLKELLESEKDTSLSEIAYHIFGNAEKTGRHRIAFVVKNTLELKSRLDLAINSFHANRNHTGLVRNEIFTGNKPVNGKTAVLLPGQGSQYVNMLTDLAVYFPRIRAWFDLLDEAFLDLRKFSTGSLIFPPPTGIDEKQMELIKSQLFIMDIGADVVLAASLGMFELLSEFGLDYDVIAGHSTGEFTALLASGKVKYRDKNHFIEGMRLFNKIYRKLEDSKGIPDGVLLSAGAIDAEYIESLLADFPDELFLAMDNCPNQMILYGSEKAIEKAVKQITQRGGIYERMPFDRAYHTPRFQEVAESFKSYYDWLDFQKGNKKVYSSVTAQPYPANATKAREIASKQIYNRMRFRETVLNLYDSEGVRTFVETGPSSNLTSFVKDILGNGDYLAVSLNNQHRPGLQHLLDTIAQLWVSGHDLSFEPLYKYRMFENSELPICDNSQSKEYQVNLKMPWMKLSEDSANRIRETSLTPGTRFSRDQGTDDPQKQALETHFNLMQDFLTRQERVMSAYFNNTQRSTGSPAKNEEKEPSEANQAEQRTDAFNENWPLLGKVINRTESELHCVRSFNLKDDLFLKDHALGPEPSKRHPELSALSVIPFTFSAEMVAEASKYLAGENWVVSELKELRGYRWMSLDRGEVEVEIKGEIISRKPEMISHVRIFAATSNKDSKKFLAFEGKAVLSKDYMPGIEPSLQASPELSISNFVDNELYSDGILRNARHSGKFHGRRFQGVRHLVGWNFKGIEAELKVMNRNDLFAGIINPRLQIDPILVDCAGQLLGFWISDRLDIDMNIFPFKVDSVKFFSPPLAADTELECRTSMSFIDAHGKPYYGEIMLEFVEEDGSLVKTVSLTNITVPEIPVSFSRCVFVPDSLFLRALIEITDRQGRLVMIIDGWTDRYFSFPDRYEKFVLYPQHFFLSDVKVFPDSRRGRILRALPAELMEDSWEIWKKRLAYLVLNQAERDRWYNLNEEAGGKTRWLMERIAVKEILRSWISDTKHFTVASIDLEVVEIQDGRFSGELKSQSSCKLPEIVVENRDGYLLTYLAN